MSSDVGNARLEPCYTCGRMTRARVVDPLLEEFVAVCRRRACREDFRATGDQ